ncbi:GGDEF domain-containing protein [Azotosporobacter soli]|uniref:GGDEF domain-containing protein n=1 Tax=Azotosporobacter soli TaxID=3055040 RepID=UPI0031FF114E
MLVVIFAIAMRSYAYVYWGYPLTKFPFFAVVAAALSFMIGWQYDRMKFLAERDSLTKCYNRRFVSGVFPGLLDEVKRKKEQLSLMMLDCDNFKAINDSYGHKKGDQILQALSALLRANVRKRDLVVRWGGDEFIIIAPYADREELEKTKERVEAALLSLSQELQIDIRISCGIATYPKDAKKIEDLIHRADSDMYGIKKHA